MSIDDTPNGMIINGNKDIPFEYTSKGIIINGRFYSLEEITENIRSKEIEEKELVILHLEWVSNRVFDGACEKIVLNKEKANKFKEDFKGVDVYFGEIAGKHSNICGALEEEEIDIISDPKEVIEFLKQHPSGHDYNHSFIDTIHDQILDGETDYNLEDYNKLVY